MFSTGGFLTGVAATSLFELAQDTTMAPAQNPLVVFLRFLVGIGVVFLLLWLLMRWMKRNNLGDYEGPGLRLLSRLQLSRTSQVAVVEIGGRMFLVGAGDSAVTPIAELYDTEEMNAELDAVVTAYEQRDNQPVKKPFSQILAKFTKRSVKVDTGGKPVPQRPEAVRKPAQSRPDDDTPHPVIDLEPAAETPDVKSAAGEPKPQVTEDQMDALASQIAAEFAVKTKANGE